MKLINADKYKKDIEHYRNTICYQRNVTMDDCMRILDKQEDALDKIRAEIEQMNEDALNLLIPFDSIDNANYTRGFIDGLGSALDCIDKYRNEVSK